MKKQFFLLSLMLAAFNASMLVATHSSCCDTTCNTSCDTSCDTSSCDKACDISEHGHTFLSVMPEFQAASPERVSLFESNKLKSLKQDDKHGALQVVVYGGKNTKGNRAAAYFLPYGHNKLTFDGSVKAATFAQVLAQTDVLLQNSPAAKDEIVVNNPEGAIAGTVNSTVTTIYTDQAAFKFDYNRDTSKILPWNFGITYAALFEPRGAAAKSELIGTGLITNPTFKSTITPSLRRSHIGAGLEFAYHFSDEVDGWYGKISTAVQHVRSRICLNEKVSAKKTPLDDDLPASNPQGTPNPAVKDATLAGANTDVFQSSTVATVDPVGSLKEAYLGWDGTANRATGFPVDLADATVKAPANVTEAFNQSAWKYGKIGCEQRITRLADIELSVGRLWTCGDCASTSWELGLVLPTGNKPCATYVAPAVVGNNQHFGIRLGSTTSILLSENDDSSCGISSTWFRVDTDSRYLFKNTQKRSFDLKGNEWSRYMMVWANKDAYSKAITALVAAYQDDTTTMLPQRGYTPGINVFTTDFHVKPQFQGRLNSAVVMCGEHFQAELGWNVHARTRECVSLACGWDSKPAFADPSYIGGVGLNNHRTIYNDSQTTVVNGVDSLTRGYTMSAVQLVDFSTTPYSAFEEGVTATVAQYDNFAITDADINYDSAATPGSISHTPYLSLGYAFDSECGWAPTVAVGGSYEFTAGNASLNQWMVWGKFEFAF